MSIEIQKKIGQVNKGDVHLIRFYIMLFLLVFTFRIQLIRAVVVCFPMNYWLYKEEVCILQKKESAGAAKAQEQY